MEMRAAGGRGGRLGPATRERLDWLAGLCRLSWREEEILALLIGLDDSEPARRWWSPRALAERLGPSELAARQRSESDAPQRSESDARQRSESGAWQRSDGEARAADETIVAAALAPAAALTQWGLVRSDGARVIVNLRIAQFLLG